MPVLLSAPLFAQPVSSPYRFIETRISVGIFAGVIQTSAGKVDAGPQSAAIYGARVNRRLTGPLSLEVGLGFSSTDRNIYVPATAGSGDPPVAAGERPATLILGDAGVRFHVTGPRSWRGLAPYAALTGGFVESISDLTLAEAEVPLDQRFDFGPGFAAGIGFGSDFFLTERLSVRGEVRDYLWRLTYPESFTGAEEEKEWRHNLAFTLGGTFHFWR